MIDVQTLTIIKDLLEAHAKASPLFSDGVLPATYVAMPVQSHEEHDLIRAALPHLAEFVHEIEHLRGQVKYLVGLVDELVKNKENGATR